MEDWDWNDGERWTEAGWVHTMGRCFEGPDYDAAVNACNGEAVAAAPDPLPAK
jgi:hypothetical protein